MNNNNPETPRANKDNRQCTDENCAVCLNSLADDGPIVKTKCQHTFHMMCLEEVQERKSLCPLCRTRLTPPAKLAAVSQYAENNGSHFTGAVDRMAIIGAAIRGRNAVRMRLMQQEHRFQGLDSEIQAY